MNPMLKAKVVRRKPSSSTVGILVNDQNDFLIGLASSGKQTHLCELYLLFMAPIIASVIRITSFGACFPKRLFCIVILVNIYTLTII